MNNTVGAYLGTQKYAATWAGDTGGSIGVLVSMINYAMCGHSNTSFDMYSSRANAHHAGFLAPWTQHQNWSTWDYPWYFKKDMEDSYRWYAQLRSKLFPYIYSQHHTAAATSYPVMRCLSLTYPETSAYDKITNEYMLGDAFLVNAWDTNVVLPAEDEWFDFYTGKIYDGPREFKYTPSKIHGGGLYVKAGSIVVMQDWNYNLREYRPDKLYIHVYPGKDAEFNLYEDDYYTYAYEKGEYAITKITLKDNVLTIYPREGSYTCYSDNGRYINTVEGQKEGMPATVDFEVIWHHNDGTTASYAVSASEYAEKAVTVEDK